MSMSKFHLKMSGLLNHFGLNEDALRKKCSDDFIIEIAEVVEEWEKVAPSLNVNADDVKASVGKPDPSLYRRKCFQLWKDRAGVLATYYALLEVLLQSSLGNAASKVCELFIRGTYIQRDQSFSLSLSLSLPPSCLYNYMFLL